VLVAAVSFVATTAALEMGPFKKGPEAVGGGGTTPFNVTVTIVPGSFNPSQADNYIPKVVRVVSGYNSTVIWVNAEEVAVGHTVTSDQGLFDSGLFGQGMRWSFVFVKPGEYPYHCTPHPWMTGSVIVLPSGGSSS
jgi:plastocyanin